MLLLNCNVFHTVLHVQLQLNKKNIAYRSRSCRTHKQCAYNRIWWWMVIPRIIIDYYLKGFKEIYIDGRYKLFIQCTEQAQNHGGFVESRAAIQSSDNFQSIYFKMDVDKGRIHISQSSKKIRSATKNIIALCYKIIMQYSRV